MHALARIRKRDSVSPLCEFLERHDGSEPRMRAMWVLRRLGPLAGEAFPCLKTLATASDDPRVRERAVLTISAITTDAEELLAPLQDALKDENPNVISAAVLGLRILGNQAKPAVDDLVPLLRDTRDRAHGISRDAAAAFPLRVDVAMTLGYIGDEADAALPTLRDMLESDDSRLRVAAAFAVCRTTKDPDPGLPILLSALKSTDKAESEAARICAVALGQLGYAPFRQEAIAALREATEHPESCVRWSAIRSLASIAPQEIVIDTIRPLAAHDPSSVVREVALRALQRYVAEDPSLLDLFIDAVKARPGDKGFMLRRYRVAEMLGEMGGVAQEALPVLRDQAADNDIDPSLRAAARKAIDKILQELCKGGKGGHH
jgi:HEAT repeat protein